MSKIRSARTIRVAKTTDNSQKADVLLVVALCYNFLFMIVL